MRQHAQGHPASQEHCRTHLEASWFLTLEVYRFLPRQWTAPQWSAISSPSSSFFLGIIPHFKDLVTLPSALKSSSFCPPGMPGPERLQSRKAAARTIPSREAVRTASRIIVITLYRFAAPPICLLPAGPSMSSLRLLFCLFLLSEK